MSRYQGETERQVLTADTRGETAYLNHSLLSWFRQSVVNEQEHGRNLRKLNTYFEFGNQGAEIG